MEDKMEKINLKVILGSTREGRLGIKVFEWAKKILAGHKEFDTEFIDLKDWPIPFYDFPSSPAYGPLDSDIVKGFAAKIAEGDAFLILTPEYNHGYSAVLKNALDHVYKEWNNKPVAFISYGAAAGGSRAVEQLRLVAIELQMAPIREAILMPMFWESFDERGNMTNERYVKTFETLLAQLLWWGNTLKQGREGMEAIVQHSAKKR
jgi:NAD(P)H-dependent FMN reductase